MDKKEVTEIIPFEVVTSWPDVIRRDPRELMYDNYDKALNCSFQRVSSDVKHPTDEEEMLSNNNSLQGNKV